MKMKAKLVLSRSMEIGLVVLTLLVAPGCSQAPKPLSAQEEQELARLQEENKEVQKLRAANQELDRLRKDNEEMKTLRASAAEIARLRTENGQLKNQIAGPGADKKNIQNLPTEPIPAPEPELPTPLANIPQAFADAAIIVASLGDPKPEDIPQEGDQILIDTSVIGILIPEFAKLTNSRQFEVSGWLKSQGVTVKNYQQFHNLGITNFQIRRAPPETRTAQ